MSIINWNTACLLPMVFGLASVSAESYRVDVDFSTTIEHRMGGHAKSTLERDRYFRSYGTLGAHTADRNAELRQIGAPPGRGTVYFDLKPNQGGDGFTSASENQAISGNWTRYTRTAQYNPDGLEHAVAAGRFPEWMVHGSPEDPDGPVEDWEQTSNKILRRDLFSAHGDFLGRLFADLEGQAVSVPSYYSPINEPPYQFETEDLADYHIAVAQAFAQHEVDVALSGPTSAWPYPLSDFRVWNQRDGAFVRRAGGSIDAYDFHFYSKGNWALPETPEWQAQAVGEPSLYHSQRLGVGTVWDHGRLEGYLDLLAATHQAEWQEPVLPVIVSEFGRQGIDPQFGPWENEFKPWLYMTTIVRQWMTFWQRPEVKLTVPFVMSESNRNQAVARGQAIYNRPDGVTAEPTRFRDFYRFFSDIAGSHADYRVYPNAGETGLGDVRAAAFRDGNRGYLVLHNARGFPGNDAEIDLRLYPFEGSETPTVEWKRLYYEGEVPPPHATQPLQGTLHIETNYSTLSTEKIMLPGEATAIVRYTWPTEVPVRREVSEERILSSDRLVPASGDEPVVLSVDLPAGVDGWTSSRLEIGLARDGGYSIGPCVSINGVVVGELPVRFGRGVKDWHAVVPLDVPPGLWTEGTNIIEFQFEGYFRKGFSTVVSAAVVGRSTL